MKLQFQFIYSTNHPYGLCLQKMKTLHTSIGIWSHIHADCIPFLNVKNILMQENQISVTSCQVQVGERINE